MVKLIAMSGGKQALYSQVGASAALPDFLAADLGSDFLTTTYAVFDDTAYLLGTDDNGTTTTENQFNFRMVLAPGAFAKVGGQAKCQLEFRFGTLCGTVASAISSVYFGQQGAVTPNFAGDQVQVKFSGAAAMNGSAASVVVSDVFTLAQTFDPTKTYVCSFFVGASNVSLSTTPNDANVTYWTDAGGAAANQASQTNVASIVSYTSTIGKLSFLEKVIV